MLEPLPPPRRRSLRVKALRRGLCVCVCLPFSTHLSHFASCLGPVPARAPGQRRPSFCFLLPAQTQRQGAALAAQGPLQTWPGSRAPQREGTLTSSTWGPSPSRIRWAASAFFCKEERREGEEKLFLPSVTAAALCSRSSPVPKTLPEPPQSRHNSHPWPNARGKVWLSPWTCRKAPRAHSTHHDLNAFGALPAKPPESPTPLGARRGGGTPYLRTAAVPGGGRASRHARRDALSRIHRFTSM